MLTSNYRSPLPSTEELPCSDDTPVDNEDQNLLPNLLLFLLTNLWASRMDWFFGVDMAIYHTTGVSPKVPIVPDGFLSLGVERKKGGKSRRSYATWEENDVVPSFVLQMVSHRPGGEYDEKREIYANLGVLYYLIYNPEFWQRDGHQPFEVYKLIDGAYHLQMGEPYWMPEVGLGIGRSRQMIGGIEQEILTWYDIQGQAEVTPEMIANELRSQLQAERQEKAAAQRKLEQLTAYLLSQGLDPDSLME
ncbi:Uma2 family endonuclease [Alkalinema sp. FACHB-956]|uniref:Uma2 family endonuclease n=1 Tax=Alkalinema sp. FACHB-956 TaxID=2692768 RepID=UPI001681C91B|nr:Uma2 family endonuclease [Alkalinema sp. FACHB-956]MBD2329002.1 Uma2 family endonuclease [Alkalinema sp. FACHB-956]